MTGDLLQARFDHAAVGLRDGRVLVIGGTADAAFDDPIVLFDELATTEISDPTLGVWSSAGHLMRARASANAVTLLDGRVLLLGGVATDPETGQIPELFDPATGRWSELERIPTAASRPSATLAADGRVVVVGLASI